MNMISYTIYNSPVKKVGITIKPLPSITAVELARLIAELQAIHDEMSK